MLAIVGCLYSIASIHHHDDGIHALDNACISCDLEDITTHGGSVSAALQHATDLSHVVPTVSQSSITVALTRSATPIRAPPLYS